MMMKLELKNWPVNDGQKIYEGVWENKIWAKKICADIKFRPVDMENTFLCLEFSPFFVRLDCENQFISLGRIRLDNIIESKTIELESKKFNHLKFEYSGGRLQLELNGQTLEFSSAYAPDITMIGIECIGGIEFSSFDVQTEAAKEKSISSRIDKSMRLYDVIDFPDDLLSAPWGREMMRKIMIKNREMGVSRICWIYEGETDGFWDNSGDPFHENYLKSVESLKPSFLKVAVEEAHRAGLEIFAIFKPFDMALNQPCCPMESRKNGKFPVLGGTYPCAWNFPLENRDLCMKRRPANCEGASKIILESARKIRSDHGFKLWVSDDNWNYKDSGRISFPSDCGKKVLFDLDGLGERFFVIQSLLENDRKNVCGRLGDFITVLNANNSPVDFTSGLTPRMHRLLSENRNHLDSKLDYCGGFCKVGIDFDYKGGIPSAIFCGDCSNKQYASLNNREGVIGVALGVNDIAPGYLSPVEPGARCFWLKIIQKMLDYGVDGVDIRITNHQSILNWKEYGFNEPLVREYINRYGIDPGVEAYDAEKMRRLKGEFYTEFIREASKLVRKNGKSFCLHVPDVAFGTPDKSTMMETHWDWRQWINEGIADEITFKAINHKSLFTDTGNELISLCHKKGIPVSFSPFLWGIKDMRKFLMNVSSAGIDAFIAYEMASIWGATQSGGFKALKPEIIETFSDFFNK